MKSDDLFLIWIGWTFGIMNDRMQFDDFDMLNGVWWTGMKQGTDGYPVKDQDGDYHVAGGQDH